MSPCRLDYILLPVGSPPVSGRLALRLSASRYTFPIARASLGIVSVESSTELERFIDDSDVYRLRIGCLHGSPAC